MKRFIVAAGAAAGLFLCSFAVQAAALWFAADDKLHRLDPLTNQVTLSIKQEDIRQLAVNTDASVWALGKKRLTQYASSGTVLVDLDLKTLSLKNAEFLALDGFDGSLWLAEGKEDNESDDNDKAKRIVHLNAQGKPLGSFTSPGKLRALALGLDQTLWLLGNKQLWHYAASGVQLTAIDLKPFAQEEPKLLAVDANGCVAVQTDELLFSCKPQPYTDGVHCEELGFFLGKRFEVDGSKLHAARGVVPQLLIAQQPQCLIEP